MKSAYCVVLWLGLILVICGPPVSAQDSVGYRGRKNSATMKKAADGLKESLTKDDEEQTARQYEALSKEFEAKGDFPKAEDYTRKALDIYTRLSKKSGMAASSRALARIQESQNKIAPAIKNYQSAAEVADNRKLMHANSNDANRLLNSGNPQIQSRYAQNNADLFDKQEEKEEASNAYKQLAKTKFEQNKPEEAIDNFKKAIAVSDRPEETDKLKKEMVKVLVAGNQMDKAIAVSRDMLRKAQTEKDTEQQVIQLRELANVYRHAEDSSQTEAMLIQSYELAVKSHNTLQAKASLTALASFYNSAGQAQKGLPYYNDFVGRLDSMIRADSSLIDTKILEVTENRIRELEKEKVLQGELMAKTTTFNYVLIGSVLLMLLLLFFIARSLYAIRIKNKKIALQSLRREMNPHFIFNSLNSVNQYIAENKELEANKYLTSYSGLMRNIMEHSNKDFVSLTIETEQLRKYLSLEHQRFQDKFDYTITLDEALDPDAVMVPNMLIQPHLENAIWHGLRYKDTKGILTLSFSKKGNGIEVIIADNGIGLTRSQALKTANQKTHQSRGITNTQERIGLLNDIYKTHIVLQMAEVKDKEGTGTRVTISMPLIAKKS